MFTWFRSTYEEAKEMLMLDEMLQCKRILVKLVVLMVVVELRIPTTYIFGM